ncbi:LysR family transcriptional regulator [Paenibacillus sp. J5C_2022]|uniref:LysR family transcriptional regulator n=1 Tax=Paenibacillus sp. J5C2022 TaxID=2977129 RepID=UPI0021D27461|nr:LysR family transcriptional regulator [Paenibacillus sp. J5C2022]MCU6707346.1 LysR family transcriptional regulator [Paenibacillus sp. J5C2022]
MDIKELNTFKTIVEEGTFSLAAIKLNYAQSTVTTQIKKLEKELGFLLFKRGWDAKLTDEGALFVAEVDNLLMHWDYSIAQAQRISNEEKGALKIGLTESVAKKIIPSILNYLNDEKPYIHCDFVVGNTELLSPLADQHKIDFAVCGNKNNSSNLIFTPLGHEEIEFIVNSPSHPILDKGSVEITDIIHYPILIGENSCYYTQSVNAFLLENNLAFKRVYNCSALHLIPQMIFGNAIGIIPKGTQFVQSNISFKVKGFDPKMPIGLLVSAHRNNYLTQTKRQIMKLIESSSIFNR